MRLLAVIPARGGSKGLPGKNIRPFAGLPLIAHSMLFAKLCPEITRCVVSTDSPQIAEVARRFGADVPFLRPVELARDESSVWPALRHALAQVEAEEGAAYDALLLLDPTSPAREPADVAGALRRLQAEPEAQGVIGISEPDFTPLSHYVIERDGWMAPLIEGGDRYERRQEEPTVYRINGSIYIWRAAFVRRHEGSWRAERRYLLYEIPESRAMSIDTAEQFERAEWLVTSGRIRFPWLAEQPVR
ncbi:MAG: acylneuraminate cytidylyltransferase family protein [Candidatus Rokubacteria bacterium]|nr:acylneuraminate cytidylyltransferase family protein [Candidatus Rokubacteria bacterium]